MRRDILSTIPPHILHIYKQTTEYISKRVSQQAGGDLLNLNSEMLKKFHACPSINKLSQPNDVLADLITVHRSFQPLRTITACKYG